MNCLVYL